MELENQFRWLVGGYYGIQSMDEYDLKEYVLKDIEEYIKNFIEIYHISNFDYQKEADKIREELSLKTKLQDSLLLTSRVNLSMELILLIKQKIKKLNKEEN